MSDQTLPRLLSTGTRSEALAFAFYEAFNARDLESMAQQYADDVEFVDRRPSLTNVVRGRDAQMKQIHVMVDLGMYQQPNVLLATAGPNLLLVEVKWTNREVDAPVEVDTLLLIEYSDDGKIRALSVFDPADIDVAKSELERRYSANNA